MLSADSRVALFTSGCLALMLWSLFVCGWLCIYRTRVFNCDRPFPTPTWSIHRASLICRCPIAMARPHTALCCRLFVCVLLLGVVICGRTLWWPRIKVGVVLQLFVSIETRSNWYSFLQSYLHVDSCAVCWLLVGWEYLMEMNFGFTLCSTWGWRLR